MVPRGTHLRSGKVRYYTTDRISLEFAEDVPFHLDGELFHLVEVRRPDQPSGVRMIYNPRGEHFFGLVP